MTDDYSLQASAWFEGKGVQLRCTQCGHHDFEQGDLIPLQIATAEGDVEPGKGYWLFPVGCKNCGHFEFFSGDKMGLMPEQYR